ncbi:hypothetical protein TRV_01686 [Trichophyton verrucosum HKI 0517]|uniref:Uncharacterized protein n=1 Tax=Trichophyton verrucosum (strain HKI 0517) TaxID=663202 RepID=D4D3M6_TRIVH|nr:uncharacterized protein TRV_01686 [Trichophyton verrucosum HKI 0517]EFE43576.1 hypothetical protein TRV_01686 [Trichophyton verrucosum HKI 0517]
MGRMPGDSRHAEEDRSMKRSGEKYRKRKKKGPERMSTGAPERLGIYRDADKEMEEPEEKRIERERDRWERKGRGSIGIKMENESVKRVWVEEESAVN